MNVPIETVIRNMYERALLRARTDLEAMLKTAYPHRNEGNDEICKMIESAKNVHRYLTNELLGKKVKELMSELSDEI